MSDTKYQITKTVRFKLEPEDEARVNEQLLKVDDIVLSEYLDADKSVSNKNAEELRLQQQNNKTKSMLNDVISKVEGLYNTFHELLYYTDSNNEIKLHTNISVKKNWALRYAPKIEISDYLDTTKPKDIDLSLGNTIIRKAFEGKDDYLGWFQRIDETKNMLIDINKRNTINEYDKQRYPEIAATLGRLNYKCNLDFVKDFIDNVVLPKKNNDGSYFNNLDALKVSISALEKELITKTAFLLPFQTDGFRTKGGSFNFYTINKNVNHLNSKIAQLEAKLNSPYRIINSSLITDLNLTNYDAVEIFLGIKFGKSVDAVLRELMNSTNSNSYSESDKNCFLNCFYDGYSYMQQGRTTDAEQAYLNAKNNVVFCFGSDEQFDIFKQNINDVLTNLGFDSSKLSLPVSLTMKNAQIFFKLWKAKQRSDFMECFAKGYSLTKQGKTFEANQEYVKAQNNRLYKFKNSSDFEQFKQITNTIEDLNVLINKETQKTEAERDNNKVDQWKEDRKREKEKRGSMFLKLDFKTSRNDKFISQYREYCLVLLKKIATDYSNVFNNLCNVKAEAIETQRLGYWCVIIEKAKEKYLYMIPRNNAFKAKIEYFSTLTNNNQGSEKLYFYESMTLNGLRKLVFKLEDNTARRGLREDFPKDEVFANNDFAHAHPRTEAERITILQEALQNIRINVPSIFTRYKNFYQLLEFGSISKLKDFEAKMNAICFKQFVYNGTGIGDKLKTEYGALVFKITSQDIEHTIRYNEDLSNPHFATDVWNEFWNQGEIFETRLNPEVKVFWRYSKPSRIHKYGNEIDNNFKNRYKEQQYTVAFTFSKNALEPRVNYSYVEDDENAVTIDANVSKKYNIGESIKMFNDKFNTEHCIKFALGIDTGTNSLAYLTAIDNNFMPILFPSLTIKNLKKYKSNKALNHIIQKINRENGISLPLLDKIYHVQDYPRIFKNEDCFHEVFENYPYDKNEWYDSAGKPLDKTLVGHRVYFVIDNPSYFIDKKQYTKTFFFNDNLITKDDNYKLLKKEFSDNDVDNAFIADYNDVFEATEISSLDLTNAKVINGMLVTNADMKTHIQLMLAKAKRQIVVKLRNYNANIVIDNTDNQKIKLNFIPFSPNAPSTNVLYFKSNKYDCYMTSDEFYDELSDFITNKRLELAKTDENINNYRNSAVANMVGVIMFIYNYIKDKIGNCEGYVAFEGLAKEKLADHLNKFAGAIDVPLRMAIFKKMQDDCLIPPLSELRKLSNEEKFICDEIGLTDASITELQKTPLKNKTYGNIVFVPEALTSKCCPLCGKRISSTGQHGDIFTCDSVNGCGFDTTKILDANNNNIVFTDLVETRILSDLLPFDNNAKMLFASINSNDKAAAYNIAKRALWK